jgi:AbrB family looped-hinge helix DNA binding protein
LRITSKGQVTIPEALRRETGMLPGTEVEFVREKAGVLLRKSAGKRNGATVREQRLSDVLDRLRGSATIRMSTEEIMALTRGE